MNKAELRAITLIVKKLGWNDMPAVEAIPTIRKMVANQQALELDCVGECDDFEETLLSLALLDIDKIYSTQYVSSYTDMVMWEAKEFSDTMGITMDMLPDLLTWESIKWNVIAESCQKEDEYWEMYEEYLAEQQEAYDETLASLRYCY
jgi:hypothetical protein